MSVSLDSILASCLKDSFATPHVWRSILSIPSANSKTIAILYPSYTSGSRPNSQSDIRFDRVSLDIGSPLRLRIVLPIAETTHPMAAKTNSHPKIALRRLELPSIPDSERLTPTITATTQNPRVFSIFTPFSYYCVLTNKSIGQAKGRSSTDAHWRRMLVRIELHDAPARPTYRSGNSTYDTV